MTATATSSCPIWTTAVCGWFRQPPATSPRLQAARPLLPQPPPPWAAVLVVAVQAQAEWWQPGHGAPAASATAAAVVREHLAWVGADWNRKSLLIGWASRWV